MSVFRRRSSILFAIAAGLLCQLPTMSAFAQTAQRVDGRIAAAHVLNRITFGPKPGDVDRVVNMGVARYIETQLRADTVLDNAAVNSLLGCQLWTMPVADAVARTSNNERYQYWDANAMVVRQVGVFGFGGLAKRDTAVATNGLMTLSAANAQLLTCRLARVEATGQQLLEVMTDFWENHFSVHSFSVPTRGSLIEWDRAVVRPRALGKFRDLLGAVAQSPVMLAYLDNAVSSANADHPTLTEYLHAKASGERPVIGARRGLNENYARELLELHTLGVDGGYTEADVLNVARAFTGWRHDLIGPDPLRPVLTRVGFPVQFVFDSSAHDAGPKRVLGSDLPEGRGMADGMDVLDMLARHPSTARHIAHKLATRFVSDAPPPTLVAKAAETFLSTDGDIRAVMRTILTSAEFMSESAFRSKVKSPHELMLSMRRIFAAPPDTAAEMIDLLIDLGQPPFGRVSPDGWPETAGAWVTAGAMHTRIDIALKVARGELQSIQLQSWPEWRKLIEMAPLDQVEGVIQSLLQGVASVSTRNAMLSVASGSPAGRTAAAREKVLRELVGLALSSPEFQGR